jgi:UDP-N-acetylglucosamine 2-epimerase (non-hydrolysing)
MHLLHVVGARPNFMKAAPVYRALAARGLHQTLVHTGQHYDTRMSEIFFRQLAFPEPDENLNVGSASHAQQTAAIMSHFEPVLLERRPDLVLVYGDVNSTLAASLVCSKLGVSFGHVESGLRSFDRSMPEEINRLLTDQLANLLFTPSADADINLSREGISPDRIFFVGNVMIDTLVYLLPEAERTFDDLKEKVGLDQYGLVTLHRPSNVDSDHHFLPLIEILAELSMDLPLIFPVHPRTRARWSERLHHTPSSFHVVDPLGYIEFLALQKHATLVITDSGGIQEESSYLGVPCLTLRDNTERPVTVTMGTNVLIGRNWDLLRQTFYSALQGQRTPQGLPPLWDGHASDRIAEVISSRFSVE